jgi:polyphosphate kinase
VLAIKHTLYRTSGRENPVVLALCHAAQTGQQVAVVIELRARFDEQANIERAQLLERAGAHVVYGVIGLKTHAKLALVVRQEADGLRRYSHIGTGNYNPITARIYEDSVFSCSTRLQDAELFNHLTGCGKQAAHRSCWYSAFAAREIVSKIERELELGRSGRVTIKVNGPPMAAGRTLRGVAGRRRDRPDRARRVLSASGVPACPRRSECARSWARSSSIRASTASAAAALRATTSAPPI